MKEMLIQNTSLLMSILVFIVRMFVVRAVRYSHVSSTHRHQVTKSTLEHVSRFFC